jgi:hypothetical protein
MGDETHADFAVPHVATLDAKVFHAVQRQFAEIP